MFGSARSSVLALAFVAAMGGGMTSALAIETLDTSKLPRLSNGKEIFASEFQTIFTTTDSVAQAGETLTRSLVAQGWQPYIQPFTSNPTYPNMQTLSFKKGTLALSVYISLAPALGNATSIQYATVPLANDLPFPKDATDIAFDPSRPHLNFISGMSPQDALEFFRKELTAQGWSPWSIKDEAKTDSAGTIHSQGQGGVAYYVRDGKNPMLLSLTTADGKLKGELKAIPMSVLQAISRKDKEPPKVAAAPAPVEMPRNPLAEDIERKAMTEIRDQLAGIRKEIEAATSTRPGATRQAQAAQPSTAPAETLHPLPGGMAPIPVPANLDDLEFDGEDGQLEYKSPSNVRTIAAFHRAQMKNLGWRETPSVINRPNMAVIDFSRGGKTISITIMQMGSQSNVRATGSGLVVAAAKTEPSKTEAKSQPETKTAAATAPGKVIYQELESEEVSGLPAPKTSSSKGSEKTPFRLVMHAQVSADPQSVLVFYRRELGNRGWKEENLKGAAKPNQMAFAYSSPEGPAVLTLIPKGEDTIIALSIKKTAAAEKAGVLPKPGQGKVLFGNMQPTEATVTINNKTVKIGAGVGAKAADGPTLDLPPGKYKFSFKIGNQPAQTDEVEISADETWGILIGPGGALALQAY